MCVCVSVNVFYSDYTSSSANGWREEKWSVGIKIRLYVDQTFNMYETMH